LLPVPHRTHGERRKSPTSCDSSGAEAFVPHTRSLSVGLPITSPRSRYRNYIAPA
jgi:hypothetical protein